MTVRFALRRSFVVYLEAEALRVAAEASPGSFVGRMADAAHVALRDWIEAGDDVIDVEGDPPEPERMCPKCGVYAIFGRWTHCYYCEQP